MNCTATGTWSSAFGSLPVGVPAPDFFGGADACVQIESDVCVGFDATTDIHLDSVRVEGALVFVDGAERTLDAHKVVVPPSGAFVVGTPTDRFMSEANIDLTTGTACNDSGAGVYTIADDGSGGLTVSWSDPADVSTFHPDDHMTGDAEPNASLLVMGGELQLHGRPRTTTWTTLSSTVSAGVNVFDAVEADDWDFMDEIVLASTDFDPREVDRVRIQTVSATPGDDTVTVFGGGLKEHFVGQVGSSVGGLPDVYETGEVALLSHNIKVSNPDWATSPAVWAACSDDFPAFGAEIKATRHMGHAPTVQLENIEVFNAGKFGQMGHYPIHFHHAGEVANSYVRGVSVHDSSNRAIVLHGAQRATLEDNVVSDIAGHAYYLEASDTSDTKHNTLTENIGMSVRDCNPLDHLALDSSGAAVFYFEDHRNSFVGNVAAGSEFAGFYDAQAGNMESVEDGTPLDRFFMCADDAVDYSAATPGLELDTGAFSYANTWYGDTQYETWGYAAPGESVNCEGAFVDNVVHSTQNGYYADVHRRTFLRILGLTAWKNSRRATMIKNKGATEMVELMAADNGSAVWPASHAYHQWYAPSYLLVASHIIGRSLNTGATVFPNGDPTYDLYGVEVYEGRVHVADTHFESFEPEVGLRNIAAFGRHRSFPFYTNNVDNSVRNVSFDGDSQRLFFEDPDLRENGEGVSHAAGYASVMLVDTDGSLSPLEVPSIITAAHDFIVPGTTAAPVGSPTEPAGWNAFVWSALDLRYGQVILRWCDTLLPIGCNAYIDGSLEPSDDWTQVDQGSGVFGFVAGMQIEDLSEGHMVTSDHAPQGLHTRLGANLLVGRDYELSLWADDTPTLLDETTGALRDIEAMEVHYRFAPSSDAITLSIPVHRPPTQIGVIYGDDASVLPTPSSPSWPPSTTEEWAFENTADDRRVHLYLQPAVDQETVVVLMGFGDQ
ncbi:MAG: G8 domain-containing protein [Myxococcota bacterium]